MIENKEQRTNIAPGREEKWRNSIPAQVFLNHFFAINYHITHSADKYCLNKVPFFRNMQVNDEADTERIKRLLCNAWSTEYAMRSTAQLGNEEYLRYALHWTFPQAYYSVFLAMQAWMQVLGIRSRTYSTLHKEFGNLVAAGAYPEAMGFYAGGHYENFYIYRLKPAQLKRDGLLPPAQGAEAEAELAQFLTTTRRIQAWGIRNAMQANPATALLSRQGKALRKFSRRDWEKVTPCLGNTTIMDMMGRLRLSSGHKEINRFVMAEIEFTLFHQSLTEIVSYLNFVHESYIAKAMGIGRYQAMLDALPPFLSNSFVKRRFEKLIAPLFEERKGRLAA
jgi:hypothetical protein